MRIDILPVQGSPRGIIPSDINGNGVGGSELFIMNLMKNLATMGYVINFYNDPKQRDKYDGVQYLNNNEFNPNDDRDILITFRGPDYRTKNAKRKKHIAISTDQFTVGDYNNWYNDVDDFIGISEFHKKDHLQRYGAIAEKMRYVDISCNLEEYKDDVEKKEYQCIFCSVPDRGLNQLRDMWDELKNKIPQLKLFITSSYGLWNGGSFEGNEHYKEKWNGLPDVTFFGRINRQELIKLQKQSDALVYPCGYDENFCLASMETQIAGAYNITSDKGALSTTNFTGSKVPYNSAFRQNFIEEIIRYFNLPSDIRKQIQKDTAYKAAKRFGWETVKKEWEEILNV